MFGPIPPSLFNLSLKHSQCRRVSCFGPICVAIKPVVVIGTSDRLRASLSQLIKGCHAGSFGGAIINEADGRRPRTQRMPMRLRRQRLAFRASMSGATPLVVHRSSSFLVGGVGGRGFTSYRVERAVPYNGR